MNASGFAYRDGRLHASDVALDAIADEHGTPVYVYDAATIRARYRDLAAALDGLDASIFFAIKANGNLAVIRTLAEEGAGAEIVSGGELARARRAGVPPRRILFAGVGKSKQEMAEALHAGIRQINVESLPELEALSSVASAMNKTAPVAFRVNPEVAAETLDQISTGRRGDKFGIPYDEAPEAYRRARDLPGIEPVGLHLHIGSQIVTPEPFERAYARAAELVRRIEADGVGLRHLDLGGGFGVAYDRGGAGLDLSAFGAAVRRTVGALGLELFFEPGRYLVAEAGVLLASVLYVKTALDRRFLILDAGMNDLIRPAMYRAHHEFLPLAETGRAPATYDLVGPICESSDVFAKGRDLPELRPGERIAIGHAGAYGAVMASRYNARPFAAEVLVEGDRFALVRERIEPDDDLRHERLPDWLLPYPSAATS